MDSINRLKWGAFWENNKKRKKQKALPLLETFYYEVTKTPPTSCFDTFTACKVQFTELENNFTSFLNESEKSQMCKYLNNIVYWKIITGFDLRRSKRRLGKTLENC